VAGTDLPSHASLYLTDGDASHRAYFEIIAVVH
jgi:hypothetical protein